MKSCHGGITLELPIGSPDKSEAETTASTQLIKKVLAELKKEKQARLTGRGRSARWRVVE